ncbi:MAG: phosphodiester glycosidase family protein [Patescibacteria group bacterium]
MRKIIIVVLIIIWSLVFLKTGVRAVSLGQKLSGMILLNVEKNGEAWYVYPEDNKRYYLGRPSDAFKIMRELGLGIKERDFQRIAQAGMPIPGDLGLAKILSGKIVLQVEKNGEAWYIYPKDLKKYYLGRPNDAFKIMRELSLGISQEDLAQVHKPGYNESINQYSKYEHKIISTIDGNFTVDIITIDLANPNLKIITKAIAPYPDLASSLGSFGSQTLAKFIIQGNGFAGMNGTYFCSDNNCGAKNYYFYPVYNTLTKELINASQLKYWTTGPILAFDENNKFYYFKDSREFKSVSDFESKFNVKLQAAIGNKPRLIEEGMNLLIEWDIDDKQKNVKALRNALAYKENTIYLVVAHNATILELANIMKTLKMEYALNLDGGSSSALFYNDEYMVGPGRGIPNAIMFMEQKL